jgi:urate oxidase
MPAVLIQDAYGKSRVRLTRVIRGADRHEVREWAVDVRLEGDFAASYTGGDNAGLIATDTMRNLVYALAQGRPSEAPEAFAEALSGHFLGEFAHVESAAVRIEEAPWRRVAIDGREHPHAFVSAGGEVRVARVSRGRAGMRVEAGLEGLQVLKTAGSAFSGFLRDRYTTLPETTDRILATEVRATWRYAEGASVAWDRAHEEVRRAMIETFADHASLSVQQTLFAMGEAALAACGAIEEIALTLPNKHRILFDLGRFGLPNENEVFVATDEPYGLISGTIARR